MKKYLALIFATFMSLSLAACGAGGGSAGQASSAETSAKAETSDSEAAETLVVYFSATGTTKGVAETIASVTGCDLFEIIPMEPYTDEDLDYNNDKSRTTAEQNDKSVRPEISAEVENWDSYSTVFVGYPIWWGEEPRILDTFAESYSFEGKTVIPFCTSGGSGIGRSGKNLESLAGSGTWLDGERFSGGTSEEDIQSWISGLNLE